MLDEPGIYNKGGAAALTKTVTMGAVGDVIIAVAAGMSLEVWLSQMVS